MTLPRPAWQLGAACRYEDPALFFPKLGQTATAAKAICARCPVLVECRTWATEQAGGELGADGGRVGRPERA